MSASISKKQEALKTKKDVILAVVALFFYIILTSVLLHFHEFGRDEWQAIQIGNDIHNFPDLIHRLRAEGHPFLWFAICKFAYTIDSSLSIIKLIHFFITWAIAFILLLKINVRIAYKILFLFGYFMFYEYAAIVRNYSLVVLFAMLALAELQKGGKYNIYILILALAGMAFTHIYGLMIAAGIVFYLFYDKLQEPKKLFSDRKLNILLLVFTAVSIFTAWCLWPEKRAYLYPAEHSKIINLILQTPKALASIWNALINIPPFIVNFHNENIVDFILQKTVLSSIQDERKLHIIIYIVKSVLLLPVLYGIYRIFRKEKRLLLTLIFTWGLFYIFQVEIFWGLLRHNGFYFVSLFLLICLRKETENKPNIFITSLLGLQLIAAVWAFCMEIKYDYSGAEKTVASITKTNDSQKILIETNNPSYASSLKGYLADDNKRTTFFINGKIQKTDYVKWEDIPTDKDYNDGSDFYWQLNCLKDISFGPELSKTKKVLILTYDPEIKNKASLDSLINCGVDFKKFDKTINDENFYVLKFKD